MRYRRDAAPSRGFLELGERLFAGLELLLLAVLVLLALAGMLPGVSALAGRRLDVTAGGAAAVDRAKA